ncbi:MAG: GntR family transcriptional regulator, partial [Gemmobacter sp.]|nr:GntR family transcriptional regulator [Gemmobacter sp.]
PVREALFQLAHEGAIEIKPRFYIRVRRLTAKEYDDIRDIRLHLEPHAGERALPFLTEADIDGLAQTHAKLVRAEAEGEWEQAVQANFDFHFGLYTKSQMPTLVQLLESLWIRVGPVLTELYPDAHPRYAGRHQHENVLEALRTRNAYALREAIRMDLLEGGRNLRNHLLAMDAHNKEEAET